MSKERMEVSELFIEIYENFNVTDQVYNMKQLCERELFLLLLTCFDKHTSEFEEETQVVLHNFSQFESECMLIYKLLNDEDVDNDALQSLINESDDKYISIDNIIDKFGNPLKEPFTKSEVRKIKINLIKD